MLPVQIRRTGVGTESANAGASVAIAGGVGVLPAASVWSGGAALAGAAGDDGVAASWSQHGAGEARNPASTGQQPCSAGDAGIVRHSRPEDAGPTRPKTRINAASLCR